MAAGTGVQARADRGGATVHVVGQGGVRGWFARLDSPLAAYYLVLGSTVALAGVGLVMVLSSSSVASLKETGSSYTWFAKQAFFAAVALPLTVLASRLSARTWRRLAWPMLVVGAAGLVLVLSPLGYSVNGNQNWIAIGPATLQPSELVKLALVVWSATVLERKRALFHRLPHVLVPIVPVAIVLLALVLTGNDLGTAMVLMLLVGGLLFVAGAPLRVLTLATAGAAAVMVSMVTGSANRMGRVQDWLAGSACTDYYGTCWQTMHGKWALATGGWWGVGLGASREKWSWLPEAHNDFIFAIIGEELGLAGTLSVLALFGLLGYGLLRVVLATDDIFVKVATGGVLIWVLGQAMINIGAVLGVFPVVGVPLPLVSSGGSALITTLIALGMVLGFARRIPGAPEALAARPGMVRRSLAVLPGRSRRGGTR
jgi:cell division protein FtsW